MHLFLVVEDKCASSRVCFLKGRHNIGILSDEEKLCCVGFKCVEHFMAAGCVGWVALVHGISFLFEGGKGRLVEVPLGVSS